MQIRIAPSLGALEGHPNDIWGTTDYELKFSPENLKRINATEAHITLHTDQPVVFFGLYGLPDFYTLWKHRGEKHILWAGSDIRHFVDGYWLDETGDMRLDTKALATWIACYCTSWVENQVEYDALYKLGIVSNIVPSFLGKVEDFPVCFKPEAKIRLYTSVSGNDFKLYGWDKAVELAHKNPDIEFHCYGNTVPYHACSNFIEHGRVPKEQMNEEIKSMTGALRLTEFDGFSEILAKSILMGQWPVSLIPYPYMLTPDNIQDLHNITEPNFAGREYYIKTLNRYPWNKNI